MSLLHLYPHVGLVAIVAEHLVHQQRERHIGPIADQVFADQVGGTHPFAPGQRMSHRHQCHDLVLHQQPRLKVGVRQRHVRHCQVYLSR
ncbi:hypothetical protein D3C72_2284420 [compost metagenome]